MTLPDALPDAARVWLFACDADPEPLVADVQAFCAAWTSHGRPVRAHAHALAGRVLSVAALISEADLNRPVGEANAGVSGCGIDAMQHAVEAAAARHGVALAPALAVTFRDAAGAWQTVARPAFRRRAASGAVGPATRVLDLTPATLGALRAAGGVERTAGEAWHATAFPMAAPAA